MEVGPNPSNLFIQNLASPRENKGVEGRHLLPFLSLWPSWEEQGWTEVMKNELLSAAQSEERSRLQRACTRSCTSTRTAGELGEKTLKDYSGSLAQVTPEVKQIALPSPKRLSLTWAKVKLDPKDHNPPQGK